MKRVALVLMVLGGASALAVEAQAPVGWSVRPDNSTAASDPDAPGDIAFVTSGRGFHATNPRAAVFWKRTSVATGSYSVKAAFTLLAPSNHTNYYGLVFGGADLDGPRQRYVYFLVAQDGTWLVKRRDGDADTQTILPRTASSAVKTPDAGGRSTNVLEVRVGESAIDFLVNDALVTRWSGARRVVRTDGIFGIRVNHFLDVQIDDLTTSAERPSAQTPETIAMTAPVDRMLSEKAFVLKPPDQASPIAAPSLQRALDPDSVVTVFGTMGASLPPDAPAAYRNRPALLATAVLDAAWVDLTKPLPPPITPDEEVLSGLMKQIAPASAALRQAVATSNGEAAREQARTLRRAFTEVEAFWTAKGKSDAAAWARTARESTNTIAESPQGNGTIVTTAVSALLQQCQSCHTAYRQPFANGAFRIKR